MPLPAVPDSYADVDLERAFYVLAQQQLGDLASQLAGAKAPPAEAAGLARQVAAAQRTWQEDLAPLGEPNRNQQLRKNVAAANELERKVTAAVPKPGADGTREPFGLARFEMLKTAVSMACSVTGAENPLIANVFGIGNEPAARQRLTEIAEILAKRLEQTSPDIVGDQAGFVLAALPATMKALASTTPKGGYIRIQPNALKDADLHGLATALVHEASHLMAEPTVDYAYRPGGLFHLLPASLAPRNAAHFEHLAAQFLSPGRTDAPADGSAQAKALLVLQFKVTRAWVRASDLTSPGPGRIPVAGLFHVDPDKVGLAVATAMFTALFAAMEAVMSLVQRNTTLTFAAAERLTMSADGAAQVTVAQAPPTAAATAAIDLICLHLSRQGRVGFRNLDLAKYIDDIASYDRPGLAGEVAGFLRWADSAPVGLGTPQSDGA
jgi:hypothetical protein